MTAQSTKGKSSANRRQFGPAFCLVMAASAMPWANSSAQAARVAVVLATQDRQAWRGLARETRRLGGRVLEVYPPQLVILDIDPAISPFLQTNGPVARMTTTGLEAQSDWSLNARIGAAAWNRARLEIDATARGAEPSRAPEEPPLSATPDFSWTGEGDVFLPPDIPQDLLGDYSFLGFRTPEEEAQARAAGLRAVTGVGPATFYTSAYMSGEIVVGAVLPESNGAVNPNVESWTAGEVSAIQDRIMTALTRFRDDCPMAEITLIFHFDDAPANGGAPGTIDCDYEAIQNSGSALSNALSRLTYVGSPGTRDYANHLRGMYDADWAFFFFVVDNSVTGGGRAFAYLGGPYSQCYGNNASSVFQHETGHIFYALDEYHPDAARSPISMAGYQRVVNANSQYNDGTGFNGGAGEGVSALMINNTNKMSAYTTGQVGWYDSNGDGILDISDSYPTVTLQLDSVVDGAAHFSGQANVSPVRSQLAGFGVGFSVNEITSVEWRLEGQAWQEAQPADGVFDTGDEGLSFVTPALPDGMYVVQARATNQLGVATQLPAAAPFVVTGSGVAFAPPFAAFEADRTVQRTGFAVNFDASQTSDLQTPGAMIEVRWDWEGDGAWDTPYSATKTASHSFASSGPYTVALEARNANDLTAMASRDILITDVNLAPVPRFQVAGGNIHGTFQPTYAFDAQDTFDPEGGTVEVRWDWDANGVYDTSYSTTLSAVHTYTLSTTGGGKSDHWTVVMQARDAAGATATVSREIWSCPYNNPPQVSGAVNPPAASTDTLVIFDMTSSTDANLGTTWDGFLQYRYDWDGDGNWDTGMSSNSIGLYTYAEVGTYQARVQIRDRFYAVQEMTLPVEVGSAPVEQPFIVTGGSISPTYIQVAPNATFQMTLAFDYVGTPGDLSAAWYVDNVPGGDASRGTMSPTGLYTAPSTVGFHQIRAVSISNPTVSLAASIYVNTNFVQVYPDNVALLEGQSFQYNASSGFLVDPTVSWYINDIPAGHPLLGAIDPNGLLTAPASVFGEITVFVKAVSNEDPDVFDSTALLLRSPNPPTADFTASTVQGPAPLAVDFAAVTTGGVTEWLWDFDDGDVGEGEELTHVFADPGLYTVSLTAIAPGGAANETKVGYVQVEGGAAPLVDFSVNQNPTNIYAAPQFTPVTIGQVDTYSWDFGGIAADSAMVGVWRQPPAGIHTISLTVTGPGGSRTKTKTDYLDVRDSFASVDFLAYGPTAGTAPLTVELVALPGTDVCEYEWDLGDVSGITGPNPMHTYTVPGVYSVSLTVTIGVANGGTGQEGCDGIQPGGQNQTASITKTDFIQVSAPPGDCDEDGDVDIADFACFDGCYSGPDGGLISGCDSMDFDTDGDVDLVDFSALQVLLH